MLDMALNKLKKHWVKNILTVFLELTKWYLGKHFSVENLGNKKIQNLFK